MTIRDLLDRLDVARARGHRRWTARCPAHDDRSPSLSIREGEDGRILIHCFAGCTVEQVCTALGIRIGDLFPDAIPNRLSVRKAHPKPWRFDWRRTSSDFLHHAEGLRLRAERVLGVARGLSTNEWSDTDRDAAMNAVCRVYGDLEWANVLEDAAFSIRVSGLGKEQERGASRHRAA